MGTESGIAILDEYFELFDELGQPPGTVSLIKINRGDSNYDEPTLVSMPISRPIIDDPFDRQLFELLSFDRQIFRMWGGDLAPDATSPLYGDGLVAEANIQAAMYPGGGIQYGTIGNSRPRILPIIDYRRGFSVENVVTNWYLITEAIRLVE